MKASEYRDMAVAELESALAEINKEMFTLINENKRSRKMEKPHLKRQIKKDRARLLTILHEKQSAK